MIIGIASPIDVYTFKDYFPQSQWSLIKQISIPNNAPAVNTLASSFIKNGHQLRIYTLGPMDIHISSEKVDLFVIAQENRYPIKYLWGCFNNASKIADCIRTDVGSLDILHAHWSYEYAYAVRQFTAVVPVYCTVRDWAPLIFRFESFKNKFTWLFKVLMSGIVYSDKKIRFVANSPYTAALLKQSKNICPVTIPNSICDDFFKDVRRKAIPGLRILTIASSNDKRKNLGVLLEAFRLLLKRVPDAELTIIGKPFYAENPALKKFFDKGLLDEHVSLMGEVNHYDLIGYLDNSSVFISSSLEETFGNTLLEAISRKVPTVGGEKSGAVPYVLHNGAAGFLCDVSNPESICDTILYLYNHPEKACEKAETAFEIIRNEYSEDVVCKKYLELYNAGQNNTV